MSLEKSTNSPAYQSSFSFQTHEAYHFKVLTEIINNTIQEGNFTFGKELITFREADENGKVLIDVAIRACQDAVYTPPAQPVVIGVNCGHFYKGSKLIKRKDNLTIVKDADSDVLKIMITNLEKGRDKGAAIRIKEVKHDDAWDLPKYPDTPVCSIPAASLQRMVKELSGASKEITISMQKNGIHFTGGNEQLLELSDRYGIWDENGDTSYKRVFDSKSLSKILSKCNGLAKDASVNIYCINEDEPIRLQTPIGTIGTVGFYLLPSK